MDTNTKNFIDAVKVFGKALNIGISKSANGYTILTKKEKKISWAKFWHDNCHHFRRISDAWEIAHFLAKDQNLQRRKNMTVNKMIQYLNKNGNLKELHEKFDISYKYPDVYQAMRKICRLAGVSWNGRIPVSMPV